jgi:hypothetical protein
VIGSIHIVSLFRNGLAVSMFDRFNEGIRKVRPGVEYVTVEEARGVVARGGV